MNSRSPLGVLVVAAPPDARLVAPLGCAVEPLVHAPEAVHSARIGGIGVVDDAVLERWGTIGTGRSIKSIPRPGRSCARSRPPVSSPGDLGRRGALARHPGRRGERPETDRPANGRGPGDAPEGARTGRFGARIRWWRPVLLRRRHERDGEGRPPARARLRGTWRIRDRPLRVSSRKTSNVADVQPGIRVALHDDGKRSSQAPPVASCTFGPPKRTQTLSWAVVPLPRRRTAFPFAQDWPDVRALNRVCSRSGSHTGSSSRKVTDLPPGSDTSCSRVSRASSCSSTMT